MSRSAGGRLAFSAAVRMGGRRHRDRTAAPHFRFERYRQDSIVRFGISSFAVAGCVPCSDPSRVELQEGEPRR